MLSLVCVLGSVTPPTRIEAGGLTVEARPQGQGVRLRMTDTSGVEYANGLVRYEIHLKGADRLVLTADIASADNQGLSIKAGGAGIELLHEIRSRPDGTGFVETTAACDSSTPHPPPHVACRDPFCGLPETA